MFRQWPERLKGLAEVCPVLLPAREARFREPACTRMGPLVVMLADALAPFLERPFAIFGHSMGALIAFELTRLLVGRQAPGPVRLFISGSRTPRSSFAEANVHGLPDDEFLDCLHRRYRAIPDAVRENRELAEIIMPALRADFELLVTYRYVDGAPLRCPLVVYGGQSDDTVSPEELQGWAEYGGADGTFRCRLFAGSHFFLRTSEADLLADIGSELAAVIA